MTWIGDPNCTVSLQQNSQEILDFDQLLSVGFGKAISYEAHLSPVGPYDGRLQSFGGCLPVPFCLNMGGDLANMLLPPIQIN